MFGSGTFEKRGKAIIVTAVKLTWGEDDKVPYAARPRSEKTLSVGWINEHIKSKANRPSSNIKDCSPENNIYSIKSRIFWTERNTSENTLLTELGENKDI